MHYCYPKASYDESSTFVLITKLHFNCAHKSTLERVSMQQDVGEQNKTENCLIKNRKKVDNDDILNVNAFTNN